MKSDPAAYELVPATTLSQAASLLKQKPGEWLLIAGGTDVMVQFAAGSLPKRRLLSVWNLPELRKIESSPRELSVGAGVTYSELRRSEIVAHEFPLLAQAASWTGGIANQNRGTLGGNIANASPAADSLPALLAYEAELVLFSVRGDRRVPYVDFHTGYKKSLLAPDELIRAIALPRKFASYFQYGRKAGARRAQAISKVCIAALGRVESGAIADALIAVGSVAPVPIRLRGAEALLKGNRIDAKLVASARSATAAEIQPIDDIRSTGRYRAAVTGNLVAEFLEQLGASAAAQ
jgi:putative cofactor-binding repeat protein